MSARSLNQVMLIGNLTRDPELRYTPQGTAVCTFSIATNRQWTPADGGERQEEVEYHRIVSWAKLAEICAQILHKGRKVFVEGRLQTRNWTGQDGQERSTTEIVIDTMIALGPPKAGMPEGTEDYDSTVPAPAAKAAVDTSSEESAETAQESAEPKAAKEKPAKKAAESKKAPGEGDEVSEDDIPF
jgi:single-strand DNA-binding protein